MSNQVLKMGDLIVIPQDTNLYKMDFWGTYFKVYQYDMIKDKPVLALFIGKCYDDFCEIAIGDEKTIVDVKDIYKAEGTKYANESGRDC